LVFEKK
jgi:hypothetical protein